MVVWTFWLLYFVFVLTLCLCWLLTLVCLFTEFAWCGCYCGYFGLGLRWFDLLCICLFYNLLVNCCLILVLRFVCYLEWLVVSWVCTFLMVGFYVVYMILCFDYLFFACFWCLLLICWFRFPTCFAMRLGCCCFDCYFLVCGGEIFLVWDLVCGFIDVAFVLLFGFFWIWCRLDWLLWLLWFILFDLFCFLDF